MTQYIIGGVLLLVVLGIGAAFYYGRRSGREGQQNKDLKKTVDVREKQLEEANKPRDVKSTVDSLRNGDF